MSGAEETCWTRIRAAADGDEHARSEFARRYLPAVRAYLAARWRSAASRVELEDAVQDVFLACFRENGVLSRADAGRPGGFRAYLYGVVRNVACDAESKRARVAGRESGSESELGDVSDHGERLSTVFDRAWARTLVREAALLQERKAAELGTEARRRVELLRLRFQHDLPIREIAARWGVEAEHLHREYARARREFKVALLEVVGFHHPGAAAEAERECERLMALLG